MTREWKPGDVATWSGMDTVLCVGEVDGRTKWAHRWGGFCYYDGPGIRRLLVIDPASLERPRKGGNRDYSSADLARTLRLLAGADNCGPATYRAAIVRELADQIEAQTRPSKPPAPPEPTGLGAVVEDAEGHVWVRIHESYGDLLWRMEVPNTCAVRYADIDAVRVLSEGVTA